MSYQQEAETRSAVESIATFAAAARPEDLTPDIRQVFKRNILDSIGCAITACQARPSRRCVNSSTNIAPLAAAH